MTDSFKGVLIVWDDDKADDWWIELPDYQPHRTKHHTLLLNDIREQALHHWWNVTTEQIDAAKIMKQLNEAWRACK